MARPADGLIRASKPLIKAKDKPVVVGLVVQDGQVVMLPPYARKMGIREGPARLAWDLLKAAGWTVEWIAAAG